VSLVASETPLAGRPSATRTRLDHIGQQANKK
jgi:hypothetical protein